MVPGGTTEILWYFAGYLKIFDDIAKDRLIYDKAAHGAHTEDFTIKQPEYFLRSELEALDGQRIVVATPLSPELPHEHHHLQLRSRALKDVDDGKFKPGALPEIEKPVIFGGGSGFPGKQISITYREGGDQLNLKVEQTNAIFDDDRVLIVGDSGVTKLHQIDIAATLKSMADAAYNTTPDSLAIPHLSTQETIQFIVDRDTDRSTGSGEDLSEFSVASGRYVNGLRQDAEEAEPPATEPPPENSMTVRPPPGQWGELGENIQINAARIADLSESGRTMIVAGDYFKTNAIVQTTSFVDDDQVAVAGGDGVAQVASGDNKAENIAEFIQESGPYAGLPTPFAGTNWIVDVVNGDYYDIRLLIQKNFLSDNDVTVQHSAQESYELIVGRNEQYNFADIYGGGFNYGLIVIAGNYHGANLIFQHTILLDNDITKSVADDSSDPSQSVTTGGNALLNNAVILSFGDDVFLPFETDMGALVGALGNREGTIDAALASGIPGMGPGGFRVLYVTGDYYDINAVWQVNVVADVDTAIQYLEGDASSSQAAQDATTGLNQLTNDAVIVDVGGTTTYVNGSVYTDTILIQANLVEDDNDRILYGDTDTLAPEIIAFTGDNDDSTTTDDGPFVPTKNLHDDTLGAIVH